MPELPEVETVKRRLQEVLPGKKIVDIQVLREKSFQGQPQKIANQEVKKITRRAKLIRFHFANQLNLLTHLKMTGQLIYAHDDQRTGGGHPTADWVKDLPSSHTRIIYDLADGSKLYFNDMRVFGWMKVMTNQDIEEYYQRYGPDVIDDALTIDYLQEKLSRRTIAIKQAIMINSIMAGLGNIYACDALNVAQIDPHRSAKSLSKNELQKLLAAARQVVTEGLKTGGATYDGKYVHVDGMSGSYQDQMKVYSREGEKCLQCSGEIVKAKIGGRGTYYCQSCQR